MINCQLLIINWMSHDMSSNVLIVSVSLLKTSLFFFFSLKKQHACCSYFYEALHFVFLLYYLLLSYLFFFGGEYRARTDDPLRARQVL